jgi:hypothetical protein
MYTRVVPTAPTHNLYNTAPALRHKAAQRTLGRPHKHLAVGAHGARAAPLRRLLPPPAAVPINALLSALQRTACSPSNSHVAAAAMSSCHCAAACHHAQSRHATAWPPCSCTSVKQAHARTGIVEARSWQQSCGQYLPPPPPPFTHTHCARKACDAAATHLSMSRAGMCGYTRHSTVCSAPNSAPT